jgi:hypothetical protein
LAEDQRKKGTRRRLERGSLLERYGLLSGEVMGMEMGGRRGERCAGRRATQRGRQAGGNDDDQRSSTLDEVIEREAHLKTPYETFQRTPI